MTEQPPGSRPAHHVLTIVGVSVAVFMSNLDAIIVIVAMPTMADTFGVDAGEISWVVLLYLLALCGSMLIFGRLCDILGERRVFSGGYLLFTVASLGCGLAPSLGFLVAARFVQGLGAAMLYAASGPIVVHHLPESIRGRAYGMMSVFGSLGIALGAPICGALLTYLSWHWIFLINVPVGVLGLGLIHTVLGKATAPRRGGVSFDLPGAVFSFASLSLLVLALNRGQEWGWLSPGTLVALVSALGLLVGFVLREARTDQPLLDLCLFRNIDFCFGLGGMLAVIMSLNGLSFLFPFYLGPVKGYSPGQIGLVLAICPVASVLASAAAGYLVDRRGPRAVNIVAALALFVPLGMLAAWNEEVSLAWILISLALFGAAISSYYPSMASLLIGHSPSGKEGATSAVNAEAAFLGATLGICFFETVFAEALAGTSAGTDGAAASASELSVGLHHAVFLAAVLGGLALLGAVRARAAGTSRDPLE